MEHCSAKYLLRRSLHNVAEEMLKTRTYGVGRICIVDGCGTLLSAYNPSSVCALHGASWEDDFLRDARKSSRRQEFSCRCAFEPCGREFMTTNSAKKYCTDSCRMKAFQARVMAARRMGDMCGARRAS
ncbi:MAG: hypothetical protein NTX16_08640 [Actinobacteria bacterium]|nr:hypothetical protein [Actinomycetota bacterium]